MSLLELRSPGNRIRTCYAVLMTPRMAGKPIAERFWAKVDKSEDCWLWTARKNRQGYGQMTVNGRAPVAHRISWELHHGRPVAPGMQINHHCDNPSCVRPDHLYEGTQTQNVADCKARGRDFNPGGRNKRAVVDLESGEIWPSLQVASAAIGRSPATVCVAARRGYRCNGRRLGYAEAA